MARTWNLVDTETISDNPIGGHGGSLVTNDDYDIVYYHDDTRVYSWNGTTQTDISGTYFTTGGSSPYAVFGLCFFKSNLYACHYNRAATGDNEAIEVSRWDGGTTWTAVRSPVVNDAAGQAIVPIASVYDYTPFSCDGSKMSVTAGRGVVANYAVNSTTDGTSWTVDTVGTAYDVPMTEFSGLETQSRHGQIVGMKTGAARGLYLRSGSDWVKQYAYAYDRVILGADDDYIYLRDTGAAPYDIYRTDDYGETETTLSTSHTPVPSYVYCVGSDAIMLRRGGTNEAATLDSGDFVADGSIGGSTLRIGGFFRLGTTLYALMNAPASTTISFYEGGTVTPFPEPTTGSAKFYHGQGPGEGVLTEKFTLPFSGVNPGAMTLDQSLGTVVIGAKAGGTVAIISSAHPYPTGTAFGDGHPTGTSVTSMKWI